MNRRGHRIAIAEGNPQDIVVLRATLQKLRHEVVLAAPSIEGLALGCEGADVELIIADARLAPATTEHMARLLKWPVIVASADGGDEAIALAAPWHPLAHLVKPIGGAKLQAAIALAMRRFAELADLRTVAANVRQEIADRKMIERAKGVVMRQRGVDESEAFLHIQRVAHEQQMPLPDVARSMVIAESAFATKHAGT
jgi:response regulator NasT